MQIRVCVLTALAQYAFTHASEGVRVNAFRAASMYTGMAARMTQLLQDYAAIHGSGLRCGDVTRFLLDAEEPRPRPGFLYWRRVSAL